jgi:D-alanyl-D-alanine carboxypeptidase/D-alanyl-D-alanine-endopeptidase (penicillin-binding protein 4)
VFGAAVDELVFNEGGFQLEVQSGARHGAPLVVQRRPTSVYPPITMQANTATDGDPLNVRYDSTTLSVVISGTLAPGERRVFNMAYRHPNDAALAAISQRLAQAGITITGKQYPSLLTTKSGDVLTPIPGTTDTLVILQSAPMNDVLRRMQKPSQNQIAELLYRTSGLVASGSGEPDSARAVAVRTLTAVGVEPSSIVIRDGSGMSRHNFLTPRAIVQVLSAMQKSPLIATFRDALPVAGVDGTLRNRMRGSAAEGNVRAKTGTLDKARSLSGFVTTADGRTLLFSLLCNNYVASAADVDRAAETLLAMLASSRVMDQ